MQLLLPQKQANHTDMSRTNNFLPLLFFPSFARAVKFPTNKQTIPSEGSVMYMYVLCDCQTAVNTQYTLHLTEAKTKLLQTPDPEPSARIVCLLQVKQTVCVLPVQSIHSTCWESYLCKFLH